MHMSKLYPLFFVLLLVAYFVAAQEADDCTEDCDDNEEISKKIDLLIILFKYNCININRFITNAAGIGGGGAILPIMMLFKFSVTQAVALSNTVICVGAVTRYVLDFKEKHPMKNATIIDYGVVVIMMPCIMIGSFIGTQANVAAPPVIVLAILLVVMIFISFRSTKQGLKL